MNIDTSKLSNEQKLKLAETVLVEVADALLPDDGDQLAISAGELIGSFEFFPERAEAIRQERRTTHDAFLAGKASANSEDRMRLTEQSTSLSKKTVATAAQLHNFIEILKNETTKKGTQMTDAKFNALFTENL